VMRESQMKSCISGFVLHSISAVLQSGQSLWVASNRYKVYFLAISPDKSRC
jgi:hypothetical protein